MAMVVWNGSTFVDTAVYVPVAPTLLETDPVGIRYRLPTGLLADPNHPGLYFADGLQPSSLAQGLYEIPVAADIADSGIVEWRSEVYDRMFGSVRYHALTMGG